MAVVCQSLSCKYLNLQEVLVLPSAISFGATYFLSDSSHCSESSCTFMKSWYKNLTFKKLFLVFLLLIHLSHCSLMTWLQGRYLIHFFICQRSLLSILDSFYAAQVLVLSCNCSGKEDSPSPSEGLTLLKYTDNRVTREGMSSVYLCTWKKLRRMPNILSGVQNTLLSEERDLRVLAS